MNDLEAPTPCAAVSTIRDAYMESLAVSLQQGFLGLDCACAIHTKERGYP